MLKTCAYVASHCHLVRETANRISLALGQSDADPLHHGCWSGKKTDGFAKIFFISVPLSDLNINLVTIKQCNLSLITRQSSPMELSNTFFFFCRQYPQNHVYNKQWKIDSSNMPINRWIERTQPIQLLSNSQNSHRAMRVDPVKFSVIYLIKTKIYKKRPHLVYLDHTLKIYVYSGSDTSSSTSLPSASWSSPFSEAPSSCTTAI